MKTVSIVVPFYNEEEMFPIFIKKLKNFLLMMKAINMN